MGLGPKRWGWGAGKAGRMQLGWEASAARRPKWPEAAGLPSPSLLILLFTKNREKQEKEKERREG